MTIALAIAVVGVVAGATPAGATWGGGDLAGAAVVGTYRATAAPLSLDGVAYADNPEGGSDRGVLFIVLDEQPRFVDADGLIVPGVADALPTFDAALLDAGDRHLTIYLDQRVYAQSPGGPFAATCAGVEAFIATIGDGGGSPPCDELVRGVLAPTSPGADYHYAGLSTTESGGTVTVVDGFADPNLRWVDTTSDYYASASPLSFAGVDYVHDPVNGTSTPDGGGPPGALFLTLVEGGEPVFVTVDNTPIPGIPGPSGIQPIDVALVSANGLRVTLYLDSTFPQNVPGGPYARTCAGVVSLLTELSGGDFVPTCDNYKAGILVPAGESAQAGAQGADFTFTGLGGFELPGAVTVVGGYSSPQLTFGPSNETGGDPGGPSADPTTTTTTTTPPTTAAPVDAAPADELPYTGAEPWYALVALALVSAGTVLVRRGETRPEV